MPSLKEAFQAISGLYSTATMDFKGRQPVNFTVDGGGAPITNLTDLTLDADGQIIGIFVGKVHVSYSIAGLDTTILLTVDRHNDFGDVASKVPVFDLTRSKLAVEAPIGDNFTQEAVVATDITVDGSTNGDFVLHFDGYIIPTVPYDTISTSPAILEFGNVTNGSSLTLPLTLESEKKGHAPGDNGPHWVLTLPTRYQVSLTSDGVYTDTLEVTSPDGEDVTVYVKFSPNAVAAFNGDIDITSPGAYSITTAVTGAGV